MGRFRRRRLAMARMTLVSPASGQRSASMMATGRDEDTVCGSGVRARNVAFRVCTEPIRQLDASRFFRDPSRAPTLAATGRRGHLCFIARRESVFAKVSAAFCSP
jgi:predicted component of type VI protein secretion system